MNIFSVLCGPGAFRLALALLVVLSHMSAIAVGTPAVFAFFTLSGYWVLRMYEQKYRPRVPVWVFYLSRALRIWLPFAAATLIVFSIYYFWVEPRETAYLTGLFLFGIASTKYDVLGVAWSLDIEMQFYLAVPLIALALGLFRARTLVLLSAVLTVLGWMLILRFGIWTFVAFLPSFLVGVLIWSSRIAPSGRWAALSCALFVTVGLVVCLLPETRSLILKSGPVSGYVGWASKYVDWWFGMAWVMILTPFIAWNVQQKTSGFDMHMGNYSYALYIIHYPVIALSHKIFTIDSIADKVIILGAIFLFSIAFYVLVDRSMERVRRVLLRPLMTQRPARPVQDPQA